MAPLPDLVGSHRERERDLARGCFEGGEPKARPEVGPQNLRETHVERERTAVFEQPLALEQVERLQRQFPSGPGRRSDGRVVDGTRPAHSGELIAEHRKQPRTEDTKRDERSDVSREHGERRRARYRLGRGLVGDRRRHVHLECGRGEDRLRPVDTEQRGGSPFEDKLPRAEQHGVDLQRALRRIRAGELADFEDTRPAPGVDLHRYDLRVGRPAQQPRHREPLADAWAGSRAFESQRGVRWRRLGCGRLRACR